MRGAYRATHGQGGHEVPLVVPGRHVASRKGALDSAGGVDVAPHRLLRPLHQDVACNDRVPLS